VDGVEVALGSAYWVVVDQQLPLEAQKVRRRTSLEGASNVFLSVNGVLKVAFILEDPIRPESPRTIRALRRGGIEKVILLTGDHPDVADVIGAAVGADEVLAERLPAEKVEAVQEESRRGTTIMVGDGINDAPALASAHVGVALGARGATASSEAADIVLMVDRLDRLVTGLQIAHRTRSIALQSVLAGMGLSIGGMLLASAGFLVPVAGALLQEGIDVAVILNALRALRQRHPRAQRPESVRQAGEQARAEHLELFPKVKNLQVVADSLDRLSPQEVHAALEEIRHFLVEELIPHEEHEDSTLYPLVAELMGGDDPTGTMSRAHLEIAHLTRLFVRFLEDLPPGEFPREDLTEFRRVLYGLYALLRLHFAQEEEHYFYLMDAGAGGSEIQSSS
jgi:soluble P-type ATPase